MLSKKVLEMVEKVCRHVKQTGLCFGGMQFCDILKAADILKAVRVSLVICLSYYFYGFIMPPRAKRRRKSGCLLEKALSSQAMGTENRLDTEPE
ncbi:hypothetical protein DPMN_084289, partial [Dreissena polymorpha]